MADGKETLKSDDYFAGRWNAPELCRRKDTPHKKSTEHEIPQNNKVPDTPE